MTDNDGAWVLYDGDCALCTGWARRFAGLLRHAGFTLATLQGWERRHLAGGTVLEDQTCRQDAGAPKYNSAALTEMIVVTPDGRSFGGADGFAEIARRIWWAWPFFALAHLPGVMPLLRIGYRQLAANRHCLGGACRLTGRKLPGAWIPLLVLPTTILVFRNALAPWVFMWLLAFSIFVACRWLTLALAIRSGARPSSFRSAGYMLAWVGMDARTFLNLKTNPPRPSTTEWLFALAKTFFGAALVWLCARFAAPINPLLAGWLGMIGIVFFLHFGLFHILSLVWRWFGVDAPPIMRAPLLSRSVAEFWGRRWNTAFHELVNRFTFRPACRRIGATPAMLLVFMLSGLIHDLLISLPALGGFGLPRVYFLVQGLGVIAEHSRLGRGIGLGRGLRGWLFTVVVTAGPAFWLFHPPFINNVILPMLRAIGAI